MPLEAALRAQQKEQVHLEWALATSEQTQLKFVWDRELELHQQQHKARRLEYEQKVREIRTSCSS